MDMRRPAAPHEPLLLLNQDLESPLTHGCDGGLATLYSHAAPDRPGHNEDALALLPAPEDGGVLVVADGLGGQPAGEQAAAVAIRQLANSIAAAGPDTSALRNAILNGIEQANHAIIDSGTGAATTLAAVEVRDGVVRPYHVGDSMILVTGQRGRIRLQTISHSPVGYAVEAGLLDEHQAIHHEHRHLISNMIGSAEMRIEVGAPVRLAPRDTLLIASDGLFDNLHVQEIVDIIRKGPLAEAAHRLQQISADRMTQPAPGQPSKPDDLSFILFRLQPHQTPLAAQ